MDTGALLHESSNCVVLHALNQPTMVIGSSAECDLVVTGDGVVAEHATVTSRDETCWITATASGGSTLVGTGPLRRGEPRRLRAGDRVTIGSVGFTFLQHDAEERLSRIHQVTALLSQADSRSEIMRRLAKMVFEGLCPSRVLVSEVVRDVERAQTRISLVAERFHDARSSFSQTLLETVISAGEPFVTEDAMSDEKFSGAKSVLRQRIRSAMGVPILDDGQVVGLIYVDELGRRRTFTHADFELLIAVAQLAASVLRTNLQRTQLSVMREGATPLLIGDSPPMRAILDKARAVARYGSTGKASVLLGGESGTGKEILARTLHELSPRQSGPFVTVNCAALPDNLIESELFGYVKGAFTGATKSTRGKFQLANGGTLFLDEVADMSLATQAKVLRAVELGEFTPLGTERCETTDCWIISATNKDLRDAIDAGNFREDLFYRLNLLEMVLPPLRERVADIPLLATHFLERFAREIRRPMRGVTTSAMEALQRYSWPGNVRELKNEIERATILAAGPVIALDDLSSRVGNRPGPAAAATAAGDVGDLKSAFASLDGLERGYIVTALTETGGKLVAAAELLGISRVMLNTRIARHNLKDLLATLKE